MGDTSQKQDRRSFSDKSEFLNQGDPLTSTLPPGPLILHDERTTRGRSDTKNTSLNQQTLIMPTNPTAGMCARLSASTELNWRLIMLGCFFVGWLMLFAGAAEGGDGEESDDGTPGGNVWRGCKWHMLYWYSALLILTAQMSNQVREFFTGEGVGFIDLWKWYVKGIEMPKLSDRLLGKGADVDERAQVGFWTLMSSAFITWIFAKERAVQCPLTSTAARPAFTAARPAFTVAPPKDEPHRSPQPPFSQSEPHAAPLLAAPQPPPPAVNQ